MQYWNSSSLILCLKYRFLLPILMYLLIFWIFIVPDRCHLGSVVENWETNLINHKRPRILLFINFKRREVSLDRCLVDCYVFLLLFSEDGSWIILHVCICFAESMTLDYLMMRLDILTLGTNNRDSNINMADDNDSDWIFHYRSFERVSTATATIPSNGSYTWSNYFFPMCYPSIRIIKMT